MPRHTPRIVIVGVCGSGKTTLAKALRSHGYHAQSIAQEHSLIAGMWRAHGQPNILIYLDAEAPTINARLGRNDWTSEMVAEQHRRLADARKYCDLYLPTDNLGEEEVLERVLAFLREGWPDAP
ncbi:MAG: AAA family ATPase [Chloroflexia bacterium]